MMRKIILIFLITGFAKIVFGQNEKVAQYYFLNAEYEKSAAVYRQLYEKNSTNTVWFGRYVESLINIPDLERAEEVLRKEEGTYINKPQIYLLRARIDQQTGDLDGSEENLGLAIQNLNDNPAWINQLAESFVEMARYDLAIETLLKAENFFKMESLFDFQLATYYHLNGEIDQMQERLLSIIEKAPNELPLIQNRWIQIFDDEQYDLLIKKIILRLQKDPNSEVLNSLLSWTFLQKNDYNSALLHTIALDRRINGTGKEVLTIAQSSANAEWFEVAQKGYDYILENKESNSPFYDMAHIGLLKILRTKIVQSKSKDSILINAAVKRYADYFQYARITPMNTMEIINWAELMAFYQDDTEGAIQVLNKYINTNGIHHIAVGNMKLLLGDIYLMNENRWDATLLYSQVDKEFKEGYLGEKARFKNANLSYYFGDFEWAQSQYKILKTTTSKLIANDAIDKSVFITDNLGLDSNTVALTAFAEAEFLVFKKKYEEANKAFKNLLHTLDEHSLVDDIYFQLGNIAVQKKDFAQAITFFNEIIENHSTEVKMDNALFALAELYEYHLKDSPQAMQIYERIFTDFSSSTFAVESRKRFRLLRGDKIQ